ncbi:glycosyltransferase [Neobacillus sp. PS3-12]|uniref:glycosyltransferase n=1 Tax=Neobacillus sp. PS3-12 TaxID=3070677 RepID=UPI0027E1D188|nr:glycosyltransferase [Neobacillus sp. PS3-12]WML51606.1 glycosyltransferase [Neobacillus sp. PS3-12]
MKKKLLIVTDVMTTGGVEKVIVNTLKGLDYSKFEVTLFIMYKLNGENFNLKAIPERVSIQYLFDRPVKGKYQKILYRIFMLFPKIVNKIVFNGDFDIIVTTKDVFSYPISKSRSFKIMWIHGGLEHLETELPTIAVRFKRWIQRGKYRKFDNILLLTNDAKSRFDNKYNLATKTRVLYNPINHDEIISLSQKNLTDLEFKKGINIICSCRLSVEKGVLRLIYACSRLLKENYDFNLIIIGDGPEREKIENAILSNDIGEKVTLLGFKKNPYKYMDKCDIYVSPSYTEGFSLSIVEAVILGLPVISTNCNGPKEILKNGEYGMLVENSESGIYRGIKDMLDSPKLIEYYGNKSQERKVFFSYEKNIRLFEKAISGK